MGIVDLSSADSAALGVVFMEVHAINARDQIGVMGRSAHDYMMSSSMPAEDNQIAPLRLLRVLLTPFSLH